MVFIFVPFCWNLFTKCVCTQLVSMPCHNSQWFILSAKTAIIKKISWYNGHLFFSLTTTSWRRKHRYHGWVTLGTFFDWMNKLLLNTTTCHIEVLEWSMHSTITRRVENCKLYTFKLNKELLSLTWTSRLYNYISISRKT